MLHIFHLSDGVSGSEPGSLFIVARSTFGLGSRTGKQESRPQVMVSLACFIVLMSAWLAIGFASAWMIVQWDRGLD